MVPTLTCRLSLSNFSFATCNCSFRKLNPEPYRLCARAYRLARALLHDLLGHVGRDLLVAIELHRRGRAALRVGPEVRHVAEHLCQRHAGLDGNRVTTRLLALDAPAPAREVADDIANELLRRCHLDGHDRLQKNRLG